MTTAKRAVIHRDRSFTFNGRAYRVGQGSDPRTTEWDGYNIVAILSKTPGDEATIDEGFWSMSDVRALLVKATSEGWDYLPDVDGNDPHASRGAGEA